MSQLELIWSTLSATRGNRDVARSQHRDAVLKLRDLDTQIAALQRVASSDQQARERLDQLQHERAGQVETIGAASDALNKAVESARDNAVSLLDLSPQALVNGLSDDTPFLLLPLRLETRFGVDKDQRVLRIRIFPDDIAIAQHEKALTASELSGGLSYWRTLIVANGEPDVQSREARQRGAWNLLANRYGSYRASWIARATKPENWSDSLTDPSKAVFPSPDVKAVSWSEAPRSFVMPDRFVVRLEAGGVTREVVGGLIPDDLPLGPDPLQAEGAFTRDPATGRLKLDDNVRWLVDFDAAQTVGMAMSIGLQLPREANGFDRILVLGLRLSSSPADNASRVARLVEAHRYSRGVSIVPQGTPTNNTDSAQSGLTTSEQSIAQSFDLENGPDPIPFETDHYRKRDGQRLAEALALPIEVLRPVPFAGGTEVAQALAMNRALWGGTAGDFIHEMLSPVIDSTTAEHLRRFVGNYVTGRGLLPALRVGAQPYGMLPASCLSRWVHSDSETREELPFWNGLLARLRTLQSVWQTLAAQVKQVGTGSDPFQSLIDVIGLQASSVEWYGRKAISTDYLANYTRFRGTPTEFATADWEQLRNAVAGNLAGAGLDPLGAYLLRTLIFWREHDQLPGPVVDDDPRVPFSETRGLRKLDGTRNYIDWLRSASVDDISRQAFVGADGKSITAPAALLYRMLRTSLLAELGHTGVRIVKLFAPAVFADLQAEPPISNIGAQRTFSTADVLAVDASLIGSSGVRMSLQDQLAGAVRSSVLGSLPPDEVAGLADLHEALGDLAALPTAALERLFAEHMDLCSYRLDAWIHGLFARRLLLLRQSQEDTLTLNLGAFGWLENVRPATVNREVVDPTELPPELRDNGPVTEDPLNGGYVHAPSLTHAVTAAILRNGYLTHAEPAHVDMMAVNLSSRRVRRAMDYLEGLRNGQELAALLGYQLERGLHENHPGVELDQFVYTLRERFPFTSRKLTDVPDGTSSEAMEARNVINGYDLLDFVRTRQYPYGIADLPLDTASPAAAAQAQAIRAEIDDLADALDAISDLMLSESVHQVVQGNYDRAKGLLQSITEGQSPPDCQVVDTPRSGRSLAFRLALPLDPAAATGWRAPLTPRAAGNAALNHWLSSVLPAASDIQWRVTEGAAIPNFVSLATLDLEPIDCVLMAGDRFGDLSSELERYLVYSHRVSGVIPDAMRTVVVARGAAPAPDAQTLMFELRIAAPGKVPIAALMPLFKSLRSLISRSRPLHARDFELPSEAQSREPANPKGWDDGAPPLQDVGELKGRFETSYTGLTNALKDLKNLLSGTVDPLYAALQADPSHVVNAAWPPALTHLRKLMVAIVPFGVPEALPTAGLDVNLATINALIAQAHVLPTLLEPRLKTARTALDVTFPDPLPSDPGEADRARALRSDTRVQRYTEAGKSLLGSAFVALPLFRVHAEASAELTSALATPIESDPLAIEEWVQSIAPVRVAIDALATVRASQDWIAATPGAIALTPLQLPVRSGDAWIATPYGDKLASGEVVSIVLTVPIPTIAAPLCGLLIDEWTEVVPVEQETTGIAFHFNRPNAMPPQVMLLAISPQITGAWQWDDLMATLAETLERARSRAVEPEHLAKTEYFQLLPANLSEFSKGYRSIVWASAPETLARKAAG
jgi:hypothetical protein